MKSRHRENELENIEQLKQSFQQKFGVEFPETWLPHPFIEPFTTHTKKGLFISERIDQMELPVTLALFEQAPVGTWLAGTLDEDGQEFWLFARKDGRRDIFVKLPCANPKAIASFAYRYDDYATWAQERPWRTINELGRCSGWIQWRNGRREEMPAASQDEFRFPDERLAKKRNDEGPPRSGLAIGVKSCPPDHRIFGMGYIITFSPTFPSRTKP